MAYNKYNSNGSINAFWVLEQQRNAEAKREEEKYKRQLQLKKESDLQLHKDRLKEVYKFLKEHNNDPAAIQASKIILNN